MNIAEALKRTNIRIAYANRWLVWEVPYDAWVVYDDAKNGPQKTRAVITTGNEEEAVKYLLYQETVPPREAYLPQEGVDKVPGM